MQVLDSFPGELLESAARTAEACASSRALTEADLRRVLASVEALSHLPVAASNEANTRVLRACSIRTWNAAATLARSVDPTSPSVPQDLLCRLRQAACDMMTLCVSGAVAPTETSRLALVRILTRTGHPDLLAEAQRLSWNAGASRYDSQEFRSAAEWFRRAAAHCHLSLREADAALQLLDEAVKLEPPTPAKHYMAFHAHLIRGDDTMAINEMRQLSDAAGTSSGPFLEACAQLSFEANRPQVASQALEALCALQPAKGSTPGRMSAAARSLVKLTLGSTSPDGAKPTPAQFSRVAAQIKTVCERAQQCGNVLVFGKSPDEAEWFLSVAWNVGREAALSGEFLSARELFRSATTLCTPAVASADTHRMCVLLSAAAGLEHACSDGTADSVSLELARETLAVAERLRAAAGPLDKSVPLLVSLELRARALLNDPGFMSAVRSARAQPQMTASAFESLAQAFESGKTRNIEACREMLRATLAAHVGQSPPSYSKCSRVLRKSIVLAGSRESALPLYEQAAEMVRAAGGAWPSDELQWLVSTCWNNGVMLSRLTDYARAEKWMSLAIGMTDVAKDGGNHTEEMAAAYAEVLERLGKRPEE
eukprot:m51a1_g5596 putative testis-expressed sequence 11 (598) ;mRNA; r:667102-670145